MQLTKKKLLALKRKRGELNLKISELSKSVGISRQTTSNILKGKTDRVTKATAEKIDNWLLDQLEK